MLVTLAISIFKRSCETLHIPFIKTIKHNGSNVEPCGTPHSIVQFQFLVIFLFFSEKLHIVVVCPYVCRRRL